MEEDRVISPETLIMEDYPMNEDKLIEQMVQRLGAEVKNLLSQARQGQVATAAVERVLRDRLWHFGAQGLGVLLDGLDQQ